MQTRTGDLTVGFVNPVKPGKRNGSIKSSTGDFYLCPPAMLSMFAKGEVCKIEFKEETGSDGTIWRTITKKIGGAAPQSTNIPQVRSRTNPVDSENMYVTALLKSYIEAGKIDFSTASIIGATESIRAAWRQTFGGVEKQRNETDMQDEVPY